MKSYVRIGGRGLKNLTYPYMRVGRVKNCQNHPYVIKKKGWGREYEVYSDKQEEASFKSGRYIDH